MRIDSINQVASLYQANGVSSKQGSINVAGSKDALSISRSGYEYQIAKQAVAKVPDIRTDRVLAIQKQLDEGTYQVSATDFATKLLKQYNSL